MEIPASARGAESSWTLAPDLSDRGCVSRSMDGKPKELTDTV